MESSLEDSSTLSLEEVCQAGGAVISNSVKGKKSKKDLTSSKTTPGKDIFDPHKPVLKKRKKNVGTLPKSELYTFLNLMSEELEIESLEKDSEEEQFFPSLQNNYQSETEDFNNQNSYTSMQDDSQQGTCGSESEDNCTESITKIGFHKSSRKKCSKVKIKTSKPFKCGRCEFKYSTPEELESHNLEINRKKEYYCEICDFNFHMKNLIKQHNANHSPINLKRKCSLCNQVMYDGLHLRYHLFTVHRGEPAHKCSYCNRTFMWNRQFKRHLYKYHEEKPAFTCEKCKKVYVDEVKYKKHVEYFHRSSFCCKICFKSFKNIDRLVFHEKTHREITKHKCKYCFRKYRTLEKLSLHEEQHTGDFEFKCERCSLGFNELSWFEKHKCVRERYDYVHQPTMCEICGKIFANRVSFKNHHILHFNPHPFECNICFKKLRWKQKLVYHKKRYHPESLASTGANESV